MDNNDHMVIWFLSMYYDIQWYNEDNTRDGIKNEDSEYTVARRFSVV